MVLHLCLYRWKLKSKTMLKSTKEGGINPPSFGVSENVRGEKKDDEKMGNMGRASPASNRP
jgi:hypothetical protein